MDVGLVMCGIGVAAAFGFGACAASLGVSRVRHASSTARAQVRDGSVLSRLLHIGVPALVPLARRMLGHEPAASLVQEGVWALEALGSTTTREALLSLAIALTATGAVLGGVVAQSLLAGVAVACCVVACLVAWARNKQEKRREDLRDAVPDALAAMGTCFRSGYSLLQTFQQVAKEMKGPLARSFEGAAHRLEVGQSPAMALSSLREGAAVPELAFVAVALDVQRQAGGSMQRVLDAASETVEGQIELRRSLRVQTAQAQLSARVVSLMPFVLIAVFSVVSDDFLSPFFESATGLVLLGVALSMELAGVVLVRRMLRVEVS